MSDCVDNVRGMIAGVQHTDMVVENLAGLLTRLEKVHSLSGRFSEVSLSPYVEKMVELADMHPVAV